MEYNRGLAQGIDYISTSRYDENRSEAVSLVHKMLPTSVIGLSVLQYQMLQLGQV